MLQEGALLCAAVQRAVRCCFYLPTETTSVTTLGPSLVTSLVTSLATCLVTARSTNSPLTAHLLLPPRLQFADVERELDAQLRAAFEAEEPRASV